MYLAIDYGEKRIGLATGEIIPKPYCVIENKGKPEDITLQISKICIEEKIEKIIIGLPQYDNGSVSKLANQIKSFGRLVADKSGIPVLYEIENFTSIEAERILKSRGIDFRKDKGKVDTLSATLLLEQFIDREEND